MGLAFYSAARGDRLAFWFTVCKTYSPERLENGTERLENGALATSAERMPLQSIS